MRIPCTTRVALQTLMMLRVDENLFYHFENGVLAFRGTASSKELIQDFQIYKQTFHDTRVHSGFLAVYMSIRDDLVDQKPRPHTIIGYSLGSAVALLYALDLSICDDYKPSNVICVASPRVGDDAFRNLYESHLGDRTIRIENPKDAVVHLPPFPSYSHVGTPLQVHFDEGWFLSHSLEKYACAIKSMH